MAEIFLRNFDIALSMFRMTQLTKYVNAFLKWFYLGRFISLKWLKIKFSISQKTPVVVSCRAYWTPWVYCADVTWTRHRHCWRWFSMRSIQVVVNHFKALGWLTYTNECVAQNLIYKLRKSENQQIADKHTSSKYLRHFHWALSHYVVASIKWCISQMTRQRLEIQ